MTAGNHGLVIRMLRSIADIADQIVIIADEKTPPGMTDIASNWTDEIYLARWRNDFAYARNLGLPLMWTDYIAWADCDEWVNAYSIGRIANLMSYPNRKAYYVWQYSPAKRGNRVDHIFVPQIRIFPNLPGLEWEIGIHEQILPSLIRLGVQTELTDLRIDHAGYYDPEEVLRKHTRNLPMLRKRIREHPEDTFTRGNLEKAERYERWHRQQSEFRRASLGVP
jgi:hypothetical protein